MRSAAAAPGGRGRRRRRACSTPRPSPPLASVRVARRLSLPAQCEVGFALGRPPTWPRPAGGRCPIGSGSTVDRRRRPRDRCSPARSPPTSGSTRPTAPPSCGCGPTTAAPAAQAPAGHRPHRRDRRRPRRRAGRRCRPRRRRPTPTGPAGRSLVQHRQSRPRAARRGAEQAGLWFAVARRRPSPVHARRASATRSTSTCTTPPRGPLRRHRRPGVPRRSTADGWDPVRRRPAHRATSGGPASGATSPSTSGPRAVGADGELRRSSTRHGPAADHLDAAAQAELDRRVAREVTLTGTAEGDARAPAGPPGPRWRGARPRSPAPTSSPATAHTLDATATSSSSRPTPPPAAGPSPTRPCDARSAWSSTPTTPTGSGRVQGARSPATATSRPTGARSWSPGAGVRQGHRRPPRRRRPGARAPPARRPGGRRRLGGLYGDGGPFDAGVDGRRRAALVGAHAGRTAGGARRRRAHGRGRRPRRQRGRARPPKGRRSTPPATCASRRRARR